MDIYISCRNCGLTIVNEKKPNTHLIIDVEYAFHSTILNKIGFPNAPTSITLLEIPKCLKIKNDDYKLIGAISYSGNMDEVGHYIAYAYRFAHDIWEEYDDLKTKCRTLQPTVAARTLIRPSIIIYIKLT